MMSRGYCIFIDTICSGMVPAWRDDAGQWIVYKREAEVFAEVMDFSVDRYRQYLIGERQLEDAIEIEDIVCELTELDGGSVMDEWGRVFSPTD